MTKTQQAADFLNKGDLKSCLKIMKTFKLSLTKEQLNQVGLAYECIVHPSFYSFRGQEWIAANIKTGEELAKKMLTK